MPAFPEIQVGDPIHHEALAVYPLFTQAGVSVAYLLSDEAFASKALIVEEITESGSVPTLFVHNENDVLVLLLEGEELRGAKQNRVLNTSVLLPPRSKTPIPVSCVEQGRWRYTSRTFGPSGHHSSPSLRHILKGTVTKSAKARRGHGSDQGAVWREVERQMTAMCASSPTGAMADTYEAHRKRLEEYQEKVRYQEGATGLAVAVGGKILSVDLFDKPATCEKVWDRLLTGAIMESLEAATNETTTEPEPVKEAVHLFRSVAWEQTPPVGAGEEHRAETKDGKHASVLLHDEAVIHGSLVLSR